MHCDMQLDTAINFINVQQLTFRGEKERRERRCALRDASVMWSIDADKR